MNSSDAPIFPTADICEKARLSRDPRFDGVFFTAVLSTRIYCRPVCPARPPKVENVQYLPSAAAAEALGFRPCLRCRPELAPGNAVWLHGEHLVARGLKLINEGFLAEHSLEALATRLEIGARQLRRLFVQHLGASPMAVHSTGRLLFAKQLLTETSMPITEVALASGFQSLRRFNSAFAEANRIQPRELRRQPAGTRESALTLRLGYRPPYDFQGLLAFLRDRALPGIEHVDDCSYKRVFGDANTPSALSISRWPGEVNALKLELFNVPPAQLLSVVTRVRRMFDLDADPQAIMGALGVSKVLQKHVECFPGLRVPGSWDGFEIAVRAVLGQQVSVAAARTLASRLVERFGRSLATSPIVGLDRFFPMPDQLVAVDLTEIGVIRSRANAIQGIARALQDGQVDFRPEQRLEQFLSRWVMLPGVGDWTAQYIAMRVLHHPDAFPSADLILRREAAPSGEPLTTRNLQQLAESWRPWRAYAVIYLWRGVTQASLSRRTEPCLKL